MEHTFRQVISVDLGVELRAARRRLGIGLREASARVGIGFSYLGELERAERAPSRAVAADLVAVLPLPPEVATHLLAAGERVDAARQARAAAGGWEVPDRHRRVLS